MAKRAVVFVHGWSVTYTDTYGRLPDRLRAEGLDREGLSAFIKPHATTMVDIRLHRIVREGVFQLTLDTSPESFKGQPWGDPIDGHNA
jgi:hypothetical protein